MNTNQNTAQKFEGAGRNLVSFLLQCDASHKVTAFECNCEPPIWLAASKSLYWCVAYLNSAFCSYLVLLCRLHLHDEAERALHGASRALPVGAGRREAYHISI